MRKFIIVLMSFCLLLGVLGFGAVSATYNGEEPTELTGDYDGWYEVKFLESGQFLFPDGITKVEVLVVAGGGGSGKGTTNADEAGGPGGAGGLILEYNGSFYEFNSTELNNNYVSVIVGLGGAGSTSVANKGSNGQNSSFGRLIALGGGGGGSSESPAGANGGCGGGAGQSDCGEYDSGGEGLQNSSEGDSGVFGWGADGGSTCADGSGASGCAFCTSQGGGASLKDGYLKTGQTVWGVTYATGGTGLSGNVGAPNTGNGGDSLAKNNSGNGKAGGSGIVIVRYEVNEGPDFLSPANASTINSMKYLITWEEVSGATYDVRFDNNSSFNSYTENSYSNEYAYLYLENGDWYFDVRSSIDGNDSFWYSAFNNYWTFTANNKPTFGLPNVEENSPYVDFNWTLINQVTNYELEVYSDEALTTRVFFEEPSYNYDTLIMDSGDYWARVRGVDDYVNGSWSDIFAFTVAIEDIPFIYTMNSVNYYGGDTMLYEFSGLDANVTYTFKINKLNDNGTFNSNIATKTVVGDGEGEGSFDYTFSNSAHYPFEVRYDETNSQLFKHFVAVRPSDRFYQAAEHKLNYSDTILAVGAGDVVYNNKSGFLHTNTLPTQCLYEYGDYFLLHYNFEWQEGVKFKILIMDMETGALMATIHSDDLYAFNHELGYAERNFIVVPTDGSTPAIVDDYALLLSYEGDDWNSLELPKGAYAYILIEDSLDNPNLAFGESVILVGDSSTAEWTITPSAASIIEGQKITWTITCNTEGIWDSYKLMRFYDTASDQYYLGTAGSPYYQSYPASYAASFTLNYNTNPALGYSAGAIFGIKPSDVPTDAYQYEYMTFDLASTYGYIVTQGYTITEATDLTDDLDSWLVTLGLGTATTKLMLSMALIILLVVVCAVLHVPVAGISIISLAAFIAMVAIGFIPIWTTVILGLALVLFMIKLFNGSGGGE